jgi:hypothetical protein
MLSARRAGAGVGAANAAAAATPRCTPRAAALLAPRPRQRQLLPPPPRAASSSAAGGDGTAPDPPSSSSKGLLAAMKRFFGLDGGKKVDKEAIAKLGAGGFISYGLVSNLNYSVAIGISWIAFVKKYGVSPLGDQWPTFLAFYAGMWGLQNLLRPARLALAITLAPSANRLIDRVGEATGLGRKWAFGILLAVMAVTTTTCLGLGLWLFGGFPPAPK